MSTTELKEILHEYIDNAEEEKLQAIYSIVENDVKPYDKWKDEEFVAEMLRREHDLETGKAKTYTLEEVMSKAQDTIKKVNAAR